MHSNFDISNFYIFNLNEPEFDSNKFISKFLDENHGHAYIKSANLRLINISGNILTAEFLYSSQDFYDFIKALDIYLKSQLIEKGPIWFGDRFDTDKVNNLYRPSILLPDNLPGLPVLQFKLVDNYTIVGKDNNRYDLDDLKVDMEIKLHFCIDGIEFHKNMCNASFSVYQVNIMKNYCQTVGNLFSPYSEVINDTDSEILDQINSFEEEE
jgi:hypothetical protein